MLTAIIKTGRKDTVVSSYNLFFSNGLRLTTEDLVWRSRDERAAIRLQFCQVVIELRNAGVPVHGDIEE
jgi:hypothetical protein